MNPPFDPRWSRIFLGYTLFGALLALAMAPLYLVVEPVHRPIVVRLGAVLFVGVALIHLRRIARAAVEAQPLSAFEQALRPPPSEPHFAPLLLKLRDEVRISRTDQRYFEHILWARILRILRERREERRRLTRDTAGKAVPPAGDPRWRPSGNSLPRSRSVHETGNGGRSLP